MDILKMIMDNPQLVKQFTKQFGIDSDNLQSIIGPLMMAVTTGMKGDLNASEGLNSLLQALVTGGHSKYVDNPQILGNPKTIKDGNGILRHTLGSKHISRKVAHRASQATGIQPSLLKTLLPIIASLVMGYLFKQVKKSGILSEGPKGSGGLQLGQNSLGAINKFLDMNGDGQVMDDISRLVGTFVASKASAVTPVIISKAKPRKSTVRKDAEVLLTGL